MADQFNPLKIQSDIRAKRLRDFVVLTIGGFCVLTLLFLTGAMGLVEWITGGVVMTAGALAYFVGSMPAEPIVTIDQAAQTPRPADTSEATLAPLIRSMPFPAVWLSPDQRLALANKAAKDVFRLGDETGMLVSAALRQPDLLAAYARVAETGSEEQLEFSLRDDAESWIAHLQAGTEAGSVFFVLQDTTAVRRAEQARADFLANASHELRTPLTAIAGFIETMRGPARNDKDSWDGFIEIMSQQTERMKRLVSDLLSLSRIEFSEHRSPSGEVDLTVLVGGSGFSMQPIAGEADVKLVLADTDISLPIVAEPDEMMQVLQNLVGNAIKYSSPNTTVTVTVGQSESMTLAADKCARQIDGATRAVLLAPRASSEVPAAWLRVVDQGPGIAPTHLPRLGERFYRVDESRGDQIEGTGLGLAIVKHIMARHRGGFAVESVPGSGSAFGIWLPLASRIKEPSAE